MVVERSRLQHTFQGVSIEDPNLRTGEGIGTRQQGFDSALQRCRAERQELRVGEHLAS